MADYTRHAIRGVAIISLLALISGLLASVVRWIMARNLTVEDYGLFYAVFSFMALIGAFKSLGIEYSLLKFIPEFLTRKKTGDIKNSIFIVLAVQLVTNVIVLTVIFLLSSALGERFFHSGQAAPLLKWMAIAFFADSFLGTIKMCLNGFQRNLYFSSIDAFRMLLITLILIFGFSTSPSLSDPVLAYIITPIILLITYSYILFRNVFPSYKEQPLKFKGILVGKLLKYGILSLSSSMGLVILTYTDTLMLTYFLGVAEVGLYNVALPLATILIFFPRVLAPIILPLSSELWAKKDHTKIRAGIELLYKYCPIIILPASFALISFSDIAIRVLFGEQYLAAAGTLGILSIAAIFLTMSAINTNFFAGIGRLDINNKIIYAGAALNFALNLALIPSFGIIGAAISTAISYLLMMIGGIWFTEKTIDAKLPIAYWAKTTLSALGMVLVIGGMKNTISLGVLQESLIVILVSGAAYAAFLLLLRVITIRELSDLCKRAMPQSKKANINKRF